MSSLSEENHALLLILSNEDEQHPFDISSEVLIGLERNKSEKIATGHKTQYLWYDLEIKHHSLLGTITQAQGTWENVCQHAGEDNNDLSFFQDMVAVESLSTGKRTHNEDILKGGFRAGGWLLVHANISGTSGSQWTFLVVVSQIIVPQYNFFFIYLSLNSYASFLEN